MQESRSASLFFALANMTRVLVRATRPKHWTKNFTIYLALLFTINEAWELNDLSNILSLFGKTTLGFVIFSILSAAVYLINDIVDVENDRRHPKKRFRPIASGQLPIGTAMAAAGALTAAGLFAAFLLEPLFGAVSLAYLTTMVAYTLVLKGLILLDVFAISAGFVLRVVAGGVVLEVPISPWLYICTGLGALFIALAKRRSELVLAGERAGAQREILEWYTVGLLDQLMGVVATSTVLAYSLYTFTARNLPDNHSMMFTIPLVIYGLFRYMYLVYERNLGENPEEIVISDAPLLSAIVLWLATAATILAVFRA